MTENKSVMEQQITEENIEEYCNHFLTSWEKLRRRNLSKAGLKLCNRFIEKLKPIYLNKSIKAQYDIYTPLYIYLIVAKGMEDFSNLAIQAGDEKWHHQPKKVELIWELLWDARDRFNYFSSHYLAEDPFKKVKEKLDQLESFFYDVWGSGLYMSSEIIINKAVCTVCGQNIKACEHITGNIYSGVPCKEFVEDCSFETISLVQTPYDMRCRIWPWNRGENMTFTARAFTLSNMDDFILK